MYKPMADDIGLSIFIIFKIFELTVQSIQYFDKFANYKATTRLYIN